MHPARQHRFGQREDRLDLREVAIPGSLGLEEIGRDEDRLGCVDELTQVSGSRFPHRDLCDSWIADLGRVGDGDEDDGSGLGSGGGGFPGLPAETGREGPG
jgi:hypothetical protein